MLCAAKDSSAKPMSSAVRSGRKRNDAEVADQDALLLLCKSQRKEISFFRFHAF